MSEVYLKNFTLPGIESECSFFQKFKMTCYNNYYPFKALPESLKELEFETITIIYGGNGSGKTTILNAIAEKLDIPRETPYNKSCFMEDFIRLCSYYISSKPAISKIITSDNVFSKIFNIRNRNEIIDQKRDEQMEMYKRYAQPGAHIKDLMGDVNYVENSDKLNDIYDARRGSKSQFIRSRVEKNIIGKSNGETAIDFFVNEINSAGLYLLDEPENSLSASHQIELTKYLLDSARFFGAQFIIATHSPFMLSLPDAKIYDLDKTPIGITNDWTSLENMRIYYDFFSSYADAFNKQK